MRAVALASSALVVLLWIVMTIALAFNETVESPRRAVVGSILLMLVVAGCAYGILRRPRLLGARHSAAAALAVTVGLVVSAPVPLEWNDGCNDHVGTTWAAAVPYLLVERPTDTRLAMGGMQTLMACSA